MRVAALASLLVCVASAAPNARAAALKEIAPVEGIEVDSGTPLADVLNRLPKTTKLILDAGEPLTVPLTWGLSEFVVLGRAGNVVRQTYLPNRRGAYEMTGSFALPEGVTRFDPAMPLLVKTRVTVRSGPLFTLDNKELFDQPGKYATHKMRFGDIERTYHTYVPSGYKGDQPVPVMFTFHGGGSYAIGQLAYSEFDVVAEKEGFIVVAPDYGSSALGRFTTPAVPEFTSAIIDELSKTYNIDKRRIYASGISMGGGASMTLAYELSDRIAAVAPVASGIARGERALPRPTTIVFIYGTRDPVASNYGPQTYEALERYVKQNGCSEVPRVKVWTPTEADPTGITRFTYSGGVNGTEIIFYRIDEGGHTWPGKYQYASWITVGLTSQHIDASQVIWDHLKEHQLPESK